MPCAKLPAILVHGSLAYLAVALAFPKCLGSSRGPGVAQIDVSGACVCDNGRVHPRSSSALNCVSRALLLFTQLSLLAAAMRLLCGALR